MRITALKNQFVATLFTAALLISLAPARQTLAASTNIYLSPATQIVTKGTIFTVAVGISTSVDITDADVKLSYPSNQIMFQDVSYSGSAFGTKTSWSGGGGSIHIGRSAASAAIGDLPLAVLTFKVLADYGTGTISILDTSVLKNAETPVECTYGKAAMDFGTATTPDITQSKPNVTYTRLASPRDYDATPPVLSNIQSLQTGANTISIGWTTNEPSTSVVEYGLDTRYGLTATEKAATIAHSVELKSAFLLPNALFHCRVTSTDTSGNTVHSTDFVFTTKSVQYTLTVRGSDGKPLPNAKVTLNHNTDYTDGNGRAVLGSSAGEQALTVSYNNVNLSRTVIVAPNTLMQSDSVQLAARRALIDERYIVYPFLVLAGLLLGLASRGYLLKYPLMVLRRKKQKFQNMTISNMQREYGEKNPAHNPYQIKRIFSFWGIWNAFADVFGRPSKKISKKIREEVKAAGISEKPAPPSKK